MNILQSSKEQATSSATSLKTASNNISQEITVTKDMQTTVVGNTNAQNSKVKHNLINKVTEFYNIHGYGNYELGRRAAKRIVDTKTIGEWYISKRYTKEQKKKHQEDFFDYLERGKFKNVE